MTITDEVKGEVVAQGTSLTKGSSTAIDFDTFHAKVTLLGSLDDLERHRADIGTSPLSLVRSRFTSGMVFHSFGIRCLCIDCCSLVGD